VRDSCQVTGKKDKLGKKFSEKGEKN